MPKKADIVPHIIKSAIAQAPAQGWRALSMAGIAKAADLTQPDLYRHFPSKSAILDGLSRMVDDAMLAEGPTDPADSPRDRLFDLLMRRFDVLQAHRDGLKVVARELRLDPAASLSRLLQLERSMRWTLEAAGIEAAGLSGLLRIRLLGLLYLSVLRVWLDDDTPDMARTMKALDQRLAQAERLANTFDRRGGRPSASEASEAPETPEEPAVAEVPEAAPNGPD